MANVDQGEMQEAREGARCEGKGETVVDAERSLYDAHPGHMYTTYPPFRVTLG